jgi:hypothetical protein
MPMSMEAAQKDCNPIAFYLVSACNVHFQPLCTTDVFIHYCRSMMTPLPILSSLLPKIIKQRCFIREWGRGEGDIFFGLAINLANILYRDRNVLYIRADIQSKRPFGAIVAPQPI